MSDDENKSGGNQGGGQVLADISCTPRFEVIRGWKGTANEVLLTSEQQRQRKLDQVRWERQQLARFRHRTLWEENRPSFAVLEGACMMRPGRFLAKDALPLMQPNRPQQGRNFDFLMDLLKSGMFTVAPLFPPVGEYIGETFSMQIIYCVRARGANDTGLRVEHPEGKDLRAGTCLFLNLDEGVCTCPEHCLPTECRRFRQIHKHNFDLDGRQKASWQPHQKALMTAAGVARYHRTVVVVGFGHPKMP